MVPTFAKRESLLPESRQRLAAQQEDLSLVRATTKYRSLEVVL